MVKNVSTWVIVIHPAALCSMHYATILITETCSIVMSTNDKIYHNLAAWAKPATGRENVFLGCKAISMLVLAWRNTVYLHWERKRPCMCGRSRTQDELGEKECSRNLCIFALCSVGLCWWQLKQDIKCHWVLCRDGYVIVMTWFCKNEERLLRSEVCLQHFYQCQSVRCHCNSWLVFHHSFLIIQSE